MTPASEHQTNERTMEKSEVRNRVWEEFRKVARPDARFHWDFNNFIADFEGSDEATRRTRELEIYNDTNYVFSTPDNSLTTFRAQCIRDEKDLLVSTSGISRGFFLLPKRSVPRDKVLYASTLDGLDYVGQHVTLEDIQEKGPIELLVTGSSAITTDGIRFGKGHGWFDIEWGLFTEVGVVTPETKIVTIVHESQVVSDIQIPTQPYDVPIDFIVTPTRVIETTSPVQKPHGIHWELLEQGMVESIAPLQELQQYS